MKATTIYTHTLEELRMGRRRIIHQGGQWSGKTVNILMVLATLANEESPTPSDSCITTVTSQSMPHLKGGALRDFESFVYPEFKKTIRKYHRTDHQFTFNSGSIIEFKAFENEMTARGSKRKRLFVNEANSFSPLVWFQLDSRSEYSIIDYNPSIRFWAHEDLIGQPGNKLFISDHRHNPFLTQEKHREIETNPNKELWKVYARGLTGNVTGVIFPNWEMIDDADFPNQDEVEWFFSVDFGYTVDPTAVMKCAKVGNTLFVKELCYKTGMNEYEIMAVLRANGYTPDMPLYCEHDPDMIRQLRNAGVPCAFPARKGPGSINAGINLLNTMNVKYTCSSQNLHRERSLYIWETDKMTGKLVNIPVEHNNHTFDAIRYGVYTRYLRQAA